jgi:hypothetical protein
LNQSELPKIDEEFEVITEGEELTRKEKLKTKNLAKTRLPSRSAERIGRFVLSGRRNPTRTL